MIIVKARVGEDATSLIKRFQKRCMQTHRIKEITGKAYFRSNTERNQEREKRKNWLILKLNEQI